jgi:hypothetical protein
MRRMLIDNKSTIENELEQKNDDHSRYEIEPAWMHLMNQKRTEIDHLLNEKQETSD